MTNTEYLQKFDLLPKAGHVLCALSGGRDSVYLLHRLMEWRSEYGYKLSAAHFNHRLRGAEIHVRNPQGDHVVGAEYGFAQIVFQRVAAAAVNDFIKIVLHELIPFSEGISNFLL